MRRTCWWFCCCFSTSPQPSRTCSQGAAAARQVIPNAPQIVMARTESPTAGFGKRSFLGGIAAKPPKGSGDLRTVVSLDGRNKVRANTQQNAILKRLCLQRFLSPNHTSFESINATCCKFQVTPHKNMDFMIRSQPLGTTQC